MMMSVPFAAVASIARPDRPHECGECERVRTQREQVLRETANISPSVAVVSFGCVAWDFLGNPENGFEHTQARLYANYYKI